MRAAISLCPDSFSSPVGNRERENGKQQQEI